jgi:uncharacterized membrane protein YedE/YeeE
MKPRLTALFAGALFGVGLVVSGMTDPSKILGFLDFFGRWNPSLMGVMLGAIGVHAAFLYWDARRRGERVQASLLPKRRIDAALVGGSAVFGVGWGLAGYCPGPGIVSLGFGALAPFVFVGTSVLGMLLADVWAGRDGARGGDGRRERTPLNA